MTLVITATIRNASDIVIATIPLISFSFTKSQSSVAGIVALTGRFSVLTDYDLSSIGSTDELVVVANSTEIYRAGVDSVVPSSDVDVLNTSGEQATETPETIYIENVIYARFSAVTQIRAIYDESISIGDTADYIDHVFDVVRMTVYGDAKGVLMELFSG